MSSIVNQPDSIWKLYFFGKLRLENPSGELIQLRSKRLETILAVLALTAPHGIARDELAKILWPTSESKQSLRQAIFELKNHLGAEKFEISADWCRLSDEFILQTDLENPSWRSSTVFMPGMNGEWFELHRYEYETPSPEKEVISDQFVATLDWMARQDAKQFFKTLQASPNITRSLEFSTLKELVLKAQKSGNEARGWASYWRGCSEEDLQICAFHLSEALNQAQITQNARLASEVTFELGKVYARMGLEKQAFRVAKLAEEIAAPEKNGIAMSYSLRLKGIVACYFGHFDKGIAFMEEGEKFLGDSLSKSIAANSRAFFVASIGNSYQALRIVEDTALLTEGLNHNRVSLGAKAATAISLYRLKEGDSGKALLSELIENTKKTGFTQFGVCAAELLGNFKKEGAIEKPLDYHKLANTWRASAKSVETPLDIHRKGLRSTSV